MNIKNIKVGELYGTTITTTLYYYDIEKEEYLSFPRYKNIGENKIVMVIEKYDLNTNINQHDRYKWVKALYENKIGLVSVYTLTEIK